MALEALVSKDWDRYFLEWAKLGATRSKDPSTKVGSCIVKDKKVLSTGYNGAPRKFDDSLVPTSSDTTLPLKDQKYAYVCHSEVNAILNYGGSMRDFEGATLYVTISPCHECAKIIIQAGVKRVVYLEDYHRSETADMAKLLFKACGVEYERFTDINIDPNLDIIKNDILSLMRGALAIYDLPGIAEKGRNSKNDMGESFEKAIAEKIGYCHVSEKYPSGASDLEKSRINRREGDIYKCGDGYEIHLELKVAKDDHLFGSISKSTVQYGRKDLYIATFNENIHQCCAIPLYIVEEALEEGLIEFAGEKGKEHIPWINNGILKGYSILFTHEKYKDRVLKFDIVSDNE